MDETPPQTQPTETSAPRQRGMPPPLRRAFWILASLYGFSLIAAVAILLRSRPAASDGDGGGAFLPFSAAPNSVGWVTIHGVITTSEGGRFWESGTSDWRRRIEVLSKTKGVKAIILDINSPGGSVGAVQEIYGEIMRIRRKKKIPFIAMFDDVAASGGYYIASACDKIVAHPGSLTGSIGVIFDAADLAGLFNKIGFKLVAIKSGKYKDIGSPARAMTPGERRLLQAMIDDAYGQFLQAVSLGRKIAIPALKPLADGRIFTGQQALKVGLVDKLGDSEEAIRLAGQLAGIPGKPHVIPEKYSQILDLIGINEGSDNGFVRLLSRLAKGEAPSSASVRGLEYRWPGFGVD